MTRPDLACVILAAGHGSRMKSPLPKVLHEVGRRPLLHHVMALGQDLGAVRQVVVVGAGGDAVAASARRFDPAAAIVTQDPPQGTGDAVRTALPALDGFDGNVLVLYADTPQLTRDTAAHLLSALEGDIGVSVLGFEPQDPGAYGRLIRDHDGMLARIVEYKDASSEEREVRLCNAGLMAMRTDVLRDTLPLLRNDNAQGEYYLTDVPGLARDQEVRTAVVFGSVEETAGVNTQAELATAERVFQRCARAAAMAAGACLRDPETVYFAHDTYLAPGVTIGQHVVFGTGCRVEEGATVEPFCHLEGVTVEHGAAVGPFARLRPGTVVGAGARVGNFVETKKAVLGPGAKVGHLTYLGDASVGAGANIGAGTITCNYDGFGKYQTTIGDGAFIGSNSSLVAPVAVGDGAYVGSGSVITKDVPGDSLAVARGRQVMKEGWSLSFRARHSSTGKG